MVEIGTVVGVIALFIIRIGIPLILLVALGVLIDRWQTRRVDEIERQWHEPAHKAQ